MLTVEEAKHAVTGRMDFMHSNFAQSGFAGPEWENKCGRGVGDRAGLCAVAVAVSCEL